MKIYMPGEKFDWMDEVYYALLKDGTIAIRYSLDSDFILFMTKSQFKHLVSEAKKKEGALKDVSFVLEPERATSSE